MKDRWKYITWLLDGDLAAVRKKGLAFQTEVECCCRICEKYWWRLRQEMSGYRFADQREEIFFFRKVKAKFIAEIEYYKLLYYAEEFKPGECSFRLLEFWKRELLRWQQFRKKHAEFCKYFVSRVYTLDQLYFVRAALAVERFPVLRDYDPENKLTSGGDWLAAHFLALRRYKHYVEKELKILKERG